jgi:hypothetical protein
MELRLVPWKINQLVAICSKKIICEVRRDIMLDCGGRPVDEIEIF